MWLEGCRCTKNDVCVFLCPYSMCVIVCQGPHACAVPNLGRCPHHFSALPVWMDITLPSIKPSPSHTLPVIVLSLSFPLCNYNVAESVSPVSQPLAPWHWEWQRKKSPVSSAYIPSFFCPAVVLSTMGGCASVSAPALYPFLSITVQVKQMIGFSQQGD